MPITVPQFQSKKKSGDKITMISAYDYTFARVFDEAGVDCILVGDSLGIFIQGQPNTLKVTLEEMVYHTKCVSRGVKNAHLVLDLPYQSYQSSIEKTVQASELALRTSGAQGIKIEGCEEVAEHVKAVVEMGIPVMGHVGQRTLQQQGVDGNEDEMSEQIIKDAKLITEAGAYSLVLDGMSPELEEKITKEVQTPTIGSSSYCDGQVVLSYGFLGIPSDSNPELKKYADLYSTIFKATQGFLRDVKEN